MAVLGKARAAENSVAQSSTVSIANVKNECVSWHRRVSKGLERASIRVRPRSSNFPLARATLGGPGIDKSADRPRVHIRASARVCVCRAGIRMI